MTKSKFAVLVWLFVSWAVMFAVTIVTEARIMARGVMPLISVICLLWFVYITISLIRGEKEEDKSNGSQKNKKNKK